MLRSALIFGVLPFIAFACSSKVAETPLPPIDSTCAGTCPQSSIKHVVVILQENHTFDDHFGGYCKAAAGSNPSCTAGPDCCETMPAADPMGHAPVVLDDDTMGGHGPNNDSACEAKEMNGGKMDGFATAPSVGTTPCGDPGNVAIASPALIKPLWDLAAAGAIADRYFQPIVGASSANDMYFARAKFVFDDNTVSPKGALGLGCGLEEMIVQEFTDPTIGDLLSAKGVPWTVYSDGYTAMADAVAAGSCPSTPDDCPAHWGLFPCILDPGDLPFQYFPSSRDNAQTMKDLSAFDDALDNGGLPAFAMVRSIGYKSEHPGLRNKLSDGITFVTGVVDRVMKSRYRDDTLVIITYDEGGGYFDHVTPPPTSTVDNKPYGTRVPFVALGKFAKKNFVSHVVMEHSSIVKFLEWNFLGGVTGQLMTRDATVNNIGSVLDPTTTGIAVPEQ
jgi:phospholipase C